MSVRITRTVKVTTTTRRIGIGGKKSTPQTNGDFERKHPRGPDGRFISKS